MIRKLLVFLSLTSLAFLSPNFTLAATDHIVISQIQIAGTGGANDEFVELFNPTDSDVDLSGYRITKKTASGTESNLVSSASGTITSHSYFLIAHPDFTGTTSDLPYSATSSGIANNNTVTVFEDSSEAVAIDEVGMGTATNFEGSAAAQNPPTGGSIRRINNQDADDNSVDFELLDVSSPRNSQSATPSPTPSPTPTPTESPSPSPTTTTSPTPTVSPTPTATALPAPTESPSPTPRSKILGIFAFPGTNRICVFRYEQLSFGFLRLFIPRLVCGRA